MSAKIKLLKNGIDFVANSLRMTRRLAPEQKQAILACKNKVATDTFQTTKRIKIDLNELQTKAKNGESLTELAQYFSCSTSTIRNRLTKMELKTVEAQKAENISKEVLEELVESGADYKFIAREFNISVPTVTSLLKKHGLSTQKTDIAKMITGQDILDMYEAGAHRNDLAEIFGISEPIMSKILRDLGLSQNQNWLSKITDNQVEITKETLEKMVSEGKSMKAIAEEIGVTTSRIRTKLNEFGLLEMKTRRVSKSVLPDNYSLHNLIHKEGLSLEEIACDYDISVDALKSYLKKNLIKIPTHSKDDVLVAQYADIIEKYATDGYREKDIAKLVGISPHYVSKIMQICDIKITPGFNRKI